MSRANQDAQIQTDLRWVASRDRIHPIFFCMTEKCPKTGSQKSDFRGSRPERIDTSLIVILYEVAFPREESVVIECGQAGVLKVGDIFCIF